MHWYILGVLALTAAALLWRAQAGSSRKEPARQPSAAGENGAFRQWLDRPDVQEALERAIELLWELMAHPELGGPGFLTLRLPQPGENGAVLLSAQYPNIRESLYRLTVRRELDHETLLQAGLPERLLSLSPEFETESGGVVVITLPAADMEPELTGGISGRRERQAALRLLTDRLEKRFPALEIRPFGTELLLTPVREGLAE